MTGFANRGLPHTSNSLSLEDHKFKFLISVFNLQYVVARYSDQIAKSLAFPYEFSELVI